jgi:solute carrier family 25 protein 44
MEIGEPVDAIAASTPSTSARFDELDKPRFFAAGAGLYTALTVALHPLHATKTRAQAACARGPPFSGLAAAVTGALPARMGYIFALESGAAHATDWLVTSGARPETAVSVGSAFGGASAALTSMVLYVPFDIVSQQQIVGARNEGAIAVARRIIATDGVRGLYRGFGITALTYLPSSGLWWGTYRTAHERLERSMLGTPALLVEVASGAIAGVVTSTLTAPLDTLKTRVQVQSATGGAPRGLARVARELVAAGGVRALWSGVGWRATHAVVWGCTMVVCYEQLKRWAVKSARGGDAVGASDRASELKSALVNATQNSQTR